MTNLTLAQHISRFLPSKGVIPDDRQLSALRALEKLLPSGGGFDAGTTIDLDKSHRRQIVLCMSFHNMDEYGGYCGWHEFIVYVRPDFIGFDVTIRGRDDGRGLKDYVVDTIYSCLSEQYTLTYKDDEYTVDLVI